MSDVAIFGTGPDGLAAGWAALRAGNRVTFFSATPSKPVLFGYQYLSAPIPLPASNMRMVAKSHIKSVLTGSVQQYHAKVFGARWGVSIDEAELTAEHDVWDLRATYDELWTLITKHHRVTLASADVSHNWIQLHTATLSRFSHVISTIPATQLCDNPSLLSGRPGHFFSSYKTKVSGSELPSEDEGEIQCDGTDLALWFRTSCVFGYRTVEWPGHLAQAAHRLNAQIVLNPLQTDCHCHPEIVRLGHHGAWRRGILTSEVYADTVKLLEGQWVNQEWK